MSQALKTLDVAILKSSLKTNRNGPSHLAFDFVQTGHAMAQALVWGELAHAIANEIDAHDAVHGLHPNVRPRATLTGYWRLNFFLSREHGRKIWEFAVKSCDVTGLIRVEDTDLAQSEEAEKARFLKAKKQAKRRFFARRAARAKNARAGQAAPAAAVA